MRPPDCWQSSRCLAALGAASCWPPKHLVDALFEAPGRWRRGGSGWKLRSQAGRLNAPDQTWTKPFGFGDAMRAGKVADQFRR